MADSLGKTGYLCDSQDTRKEFGIWWEKLEQEQEVKMKKKNPQIFICWTRH